MAKNDSVHAADGQPVPRTRVALRQSVDAEPSTTPPPWNDHLKEFGLEGRFHHPVSGSRRTCSPSTVCRRQDRCEVRSSRSIIWLADIVIWGSRRFRGL